MRSSTWRLEDLRNVILNLGFVGENLHTRQIFDCKKMFDQYPNASVSMTVTPPEGEPYPGTIERDGDLVIWDVRDSDLVAEGDGEIQIVFTQEPHIARSYNARTHICRSQVPTGSIPSGLDDYITRADQLLDEVKDTFPAGGTTGQVLAKKSDTDYDTEWVDQGGGTEDYDELENRPQIGGVTLTGNKTLHDLGAASEGDVDAKYTKPEGGIPASDIADGVIPDPEDLIDDTAGEGDTDKVWSADKSHELLTEINSNAEKLSDMEVPKKLVGFEVEKCVNTGYITNTGELYDLTNTGFYTTDYIPVSEGDVIAYRLVASPGDMHPVYIITAYDSEKVRIADGCVSGDSNQILTGVYTVASGTAFVRICGRKSSAGFVSDDTVYGFCNAEEVVNDNIGYLNFFTLPGYFGSSGSIDSASSAKEVRTNIIPVTPNKTVFDISLKYSTTVSMWMAVAYFNSSMGFVSRDTLVSESNSSKEVHLEITNSSIAYVAFTWRSFNENPATIRVKPNKIGEGSSVEISDSAGFGDTGKVWSANKSYLDINAVVLPENPGYITSNGVISAPDATTKKEVYTNALPVEKDDVINIILEYASSNSMWLAYALYDSSQNFVSRTTLVDNVTQLSATRSITIPSGAKYIRITYRTYGTHTVKIASSGKNRILTDQITDNTKDSDLEMGIITINSNVRAINHRGYNKVAPENTIPAYILSKRKGFNYVECDVSFTSDGVPVILHDSTINRTARNSDGTEISSTVNITDITYEEALEYDFGIYKGSEYAGTTIPTLKELVELCRNIGLHLYIELKSTGSSQQLVEDCADIVRDAGMENHVTWISFSDTLLGYIKAVEPSAHLALVVNSVTSAKISEAEALKTTTNDVIVDSGSWTSAEIALCRQAKLPMEVWTVDTASTIIGLDPYISGVTSDDLNAGYLLYKNVMGY